MAVRGFASSCIICGRRTPDGGARCDLHKLSEADRVERSPYRRGYKGGGYAAARRLRLHQAGGRCERCGVPTSKLQAHHVVPLSAGGSNAIENLRALCPRCHREVEPGRS